MLGNQRSGGLWTLYHRAALLSGLVTEQRRSTPAGADVAEAWLGEVPAKVLRQVRKEEPATLRVKRNSTTPTDEAAALSSVLTDGLPADRPLLRDRLVRGGPTSGSAADRTGGVQADLVACLDGLPSDVVAGGRRELVLALVAAAGARGAGRLEDGLLDAVACESVLHPAQAVLDHVLVAGHGRTSKEVALQVGSAWPDLPAAVDADRFEGASRHLWPVLGGERTREWVMCAQHMRAGSWDDAVQDVLRVNASAMLARRGAPWASRTASGRIDVRVQVGAPLPAQDDVLLGWRNPYYLPPILTLRRDLGAAA